MVSRIYIDESDHDESDSEGESEALGKDATVEQMRQALKREQLKNQKLIESNRKLRETYGDIDVSTGPQKNGKKRKSDSNVPEELLEHVETITRLGKKCAVMLSIWIPEGAFGRKRPLIDYRDAAQRYASAESQDMALVAELYDFIPEELHAYVKGLPKFGDIFRTGTSACRSSALYNVRSSAATIFNLDRKYFAGEHSLRDCNEILQLLGYKKDKNTYDSWPPILYPNNVKNMRKPFRNTALPLILKIALHGAGALNSAAKGKPKVNAKLWGVTSVNDSAIAFAAILGRFILSKDSEFAAKGVATGIKYEVDFWKYRKMLAQADDAARDDLINFYNKTVFPNTSQLPCKKRDDDEEEEDLTDAIAAFNLGPGGDDSILDEHSENLGLSVGVDAPDTPGPLSPPALNVNTPPETPPTPPETTTAIQPRMPTDTEAPAEVVNGVSSGSDIGEPPKLQYDELGELEKADGTVPKTTRISRIRPHSTFANEDTATQRPARTRKGASKENGNAKGDSADPGKREKKGSSSNSTSKGGEKAISVNKPTSRRSVIESEEE